MKIKNIKASIHSTAISVPLLEGKVQGYGREEQKECGQSVCLRSRKRHPESRGGKRREE